MTRMMYDDVSVLSAPAMGQVFPRMTGSAVFLGVPVPSAYGQRMLNISALCVDRHLGDHADRPAISRQGNGAQSVSYRDLHERVCRLANALTDQGVQRGDRVAIHLPLMVESVVAVLACMRIGAVHVVLPAMPGAMPLRERLVDCGAVAVLTGNETIRDTDRAPLKVTLDEALDTAGARCRVKLVLVVTAGDADITMKPGRDHRHDAVVDWYEPDYAPEVMYEDDPLFMLYPAGRAGRRHGVTYTAGEYGRLTSCTMDMLLPPGDAGIPGALVEMAWNTGQTALIVGVLAKGDTIMIDGYARTAAISGN
ncbi:acetyl-CoA synthetase [Komagataeibacter diospyri]|uniref:AMP-binding protein n=1 Tax=Komagataeibacter diospyri TaxID=1932662 RepID=UPI001137DD35|nr:AMP-binding protein [Komagataeibacter diospyri]GCE88746.1 acetyl-CoA synthetase [Komagataeibacter diospyri]